MNKQYIPFVAILIICVLAAVFLTHSCDKPVDKIKPLETIKYDNTADSLKSLLKLHEDSESVWKQRAVFFKTTIITDIKKEKDDRFKIRSLPPLGLQHFHDSLMRSVGL